jgi:hypothetical protein
MFISFAPVVLVWLLLPVGTSAQGTSARDWLTWGYDQERTGWNKGETRLSKDNISRLKLKWSTVVERREHATRQKLGFPGRSQKGFPNKLRAPQMATWLCSNTQNATPR